ncbi:MAG: nucleoside triphosphate pyrophosphohydrolase [Patescibacteria group bacterium]|nr:nucleoside triphosphate pyrophosphohydrolase [Patescibacteria group bacterium]
MKYNKLIRDKIPEIVETKGEIAITHIATEEEYWKKLLEKLHEEVSEFSESVDEEEMADILEVLYAICDAKNIDRTHLEKLRKKKAGERGGFKKKIILDEVRKKEWNGMQGK